MHLPQSRFNCPLSERGRPSSCELPPFSVPPGTPECSLCLCFFLQVYYFMSFFPIPFIFFWGGCIPTTCGTSQPKGANPCHSSNPSRFSDNTRPLTRCITSEFLFPHLYEPLAIVLIIYHKEVLIFLLHVLKDI